MPDYSAPVIMTGADEHTVEDFCNNIHRTLIHSFKHALVWGTSVKHNPGTVGKAHVLHDPHLLHKSFRAGYAAAEMPAWLKRLDDETEQIFKEVIEPKLAEAFPPKRRRGRRKG